MNNTLEDLFGQPIHSYSRAEAIEDGILIDVTETTKEVGIKWPVAVTAQLFNFIEPTEKEQEQGQDVEGRLWDTLYLFTLTARKTEGPLMQYRVNYIREQPNRTVKTETVTIKAVIGPGDSTEPVITLMLPHED